jgi:hypothetical protein
MVIMNTMKFVFVLLLAATTAFGDAVRLGDLDFASAEQGWGQLQINKSVGDQPLAIAGKTYVHGLGTHAASEIVYELDGAFTNFTAWVGVDDFLKNNPEAPKASVVFQVFGDGKKLFDSGVMKIGEPAKRVSVDVAGVQELKLVVTDAGDGISCDHADWAEPVLEGRPVKPALQEVTLAGFTVGLGTKVAGAKTTERFIRDKTGIRWEVEITSTNAFGSAPIITRLNCGRPEGKLIWAAWGATDKGAWNDPLVPVAFLNRRWHYGNVAQGCPVGSDFVSLPLISILDPARDTGISLVLSPEDVLLNVDLAVTADGQVRFTRTNHRLGGGKTVKFTMHLVAHEASWRGGLRFMTARYPQFFEAPNPRAHKIGGCGAYSTGEQAIDVAKFKKMAFGFNWKLSDDFPYMGMFIPPVKNADEKWQRSCDERSAAYKGPTSSCRQMNDYAHYMKTNGFAVLSYFNVTEFGKKMYGRKPVKQPDDPQLWQDPAGYIKYKLPNAVVDPGIQTCYHAYIVDPGDSGYMAFMLEQAARNTKMLPATDGICIDRADWLRIYNRHADDAVSWIEGKPARSLFRSWIDFMSKLGPQMHRSDKVIFSNMMTMRLELCRQLDGIYTEFGNNGNALNTSALLGLRKPVVCWTYNETLNQPGPDAFMQRHLHMGCFPTAPYPANNHCINPEPKADQLYIDYGPLLNSLRGKKWVLAPHCVESSDAKVNLFEVPGGYALPVTFGGETATVRVRGIGKVKCEVLYPGSEKPVPLTGNFKDGTLELTVPVERGCAMVLLRNS